jgi:hypothetical protein
VSVISLTEILMVGQQLYSQNFLVMETMTAVAFYYTINISVREITDTSELSFTMAIYSLASAGRATRSAELSGHGDHDRRGVLLHLYRHGVRFSAETAGELPTAVMVSMTRKFCE